MTALVTREKYLDSVRELRAAAEALNGRFSLTQLTWQPGGGEGWSIAECFDHIAVSNNIYLDAMDAALPGAATGPEAGVFHAAGLPSAKFIESLEPLSKRKHSAPMKIRPRATLNPESIFPRFLKSLSRLESLVSATNSKDLNRTRFQNPLVPLVRFTLASGLLIMAAHTRRHLWQAEQVTLAEGFPR